MPNALSAATTPPPPPNINQQAPMGSGGPPAGMPQTSSPPPAPSHAQTVAALRHFDAAAKGVSALLKDPDCGKTDMKSEVIDGVAKLVSKGMMTAPDAVQTLGTFPEKPFDQKKVARGKDDAGRPSGRSRANSSCRGISGDAKRAWQRAAKAPATGSPAHSVAVAAAPDTVRPKDFGQARFAPR